jgi:YHS domain-containing protein
MRGLVYITVVILVVILVSRMLNAWQRGVGATRGIRRDELVKDPVCQTYVVRSRAVTEEVDGAVTHFCSRECASRFVRGERRR